MGFWNDKLEFDIYELQKTKEKCDSLKTTLEEKKQKLMEELKTLRDNWQTDAGKEFFEGQNTDWSAQIDSYVKITEAISQLLEIAINQYGHVIDEAKRLNV